MSFVQQALFLIYQKIDDIEELNLNNYYRQLTKKDMIAEFEKWINLENDINYTFYKNTMYSIILTPFEYEVLYQEWINLI